MDEKKYCLRPLSEVRRLRKEVSCVAVDTTHERCSRYEAGPNSAGMRAEIFHDYYKPTPLSQKTKAEDYSEESVVTQEIDSSACVRRVYEAQVASKDGFGQRPNGCFVSWDQAKEACIGPVVPVERYAIMVGGRRVRLVETDTKRLYDGVREKEVEDALNKLSDRERSLIIKYLSGNKQT